MTVKVETETGFWLAWATIPETFDPCVGDRARFVATLERGNEDHFARAKRPTKCEIHKEEA